MRGSLRQLTHLNAGQSLTQLQDLSLANNSLSGNIASFGSLRQLTHLNAGQNFVRGDVAALANLTELEALILDGKGPDFQGTLSGNLSFVRGMSELRTLSLEGQNLSGG